MHRRHVHGDSEAFGLLFTRHKDRLWAVAVRTLGDPEGAADALQDAIIAMPEVIACHMVSGDIDYLLEVVVPHLQRYERFLLDRLLAEPMIKEVRSSIAISALKVAAPLPLDHLDTSTAVRPKARS